MTGGGDSARRCICYSISCVLCAELLKGVGAVQGSLRRGRSVGDTGVAPSGAWHVGVSLHVGGARAPHRSSEVFQACRFSTLYF